MRIQIISHTQPQNVDKLIGRWSILPAYFKKHGNQIDYILRNQWLGFFSRYRRFKPDLIIATGPIGAFVAFFRKLGIISVPVIHDWNDNYAEIMGKKWGIFVKILEKYAIKNSNIVVSCSYYRFERAKQLGKKAGKNLFYIPHGIHAEYFKNIKKVNLPGKNKMKLLYVGEQSIQKRVDLLINAMKNLDADLILIGKENPEFKPAKNVFFIGQKNQAQIPSYLKKTDFLVLTENNDSALKLFEYLASGKPILVPKGRISKYFKSNNIIPYNSFDDLTRLIKIRKKIKPEKVLSWEEIAQKYLKLLEKCAE